MNKTTSMNGALILIAIALAGAGVSYHFTLQTRFASIEQKLDQNSLALQQYQASQESLVASKMDTLNTLNKEIDSLQASLAPLGRTTHDQTDSLDEIHKQIATLQQSQQAQQAAEKKLADYAAQLDTMKHDIQAQKISAPAPTTTTIQTTPAISAPVTSVVSPVALPVLAPHASSPPIMLPLPPRAESAVDIRPDQSPIIAQDPSVRALPVALPVADVR